MIKSFEEIKDSKNLVRMPYFGGILTDNSYRFKTGKIKPVVSVWMDDLGEKVKELGLPLAEKYKIKLFGRFWDERRPDLGNLHKVLGDSIKRGLVADDKHYFYEDLGYELGVMEEELVIIIEPINILMEIIKE
jgi:hypothetical protein